MSAGVPKKEPSYIHMGKNKITVHGATRGLKAYIQWGAAWFPKGIVTTLLPPPQCHAAFSTMPSTLAWVDQCPVSQRVHGNPHQSIPSTTVTASRVTQDRAEYESTIP